MPTSFPTTLDDFPNLAAYDGANLAQAIANINDSIEAIQARLGIDGIHGRLVHKTVTLTSAAAATPVEVFSAAQIGSTRAFYPLGFLIRVNGATGWGTTANVKIQDTNGTPVDFATILVALLTNAARVGCDPKTNLTIEDAWSLGTGGTVGKGVQVVGNANGTGSDLKITVWGIVK